MRATSAYPQASLLHFLGGQVFRIQSGFRVLPKLQDELELGEAGESTILCYGLPHPGQMVFRSICSRSTAVLQASRRVLA